jgi:hypothetical protein
MNQHAFVGLVLLAVLVPLTAVRGEDEAPAGSELHRDLTRFPPGSCEMVQAWDQTISETVERGEEPEKRESRSWNRFTFDVELAPAKDDPETSAGVKVTWRRVQIGIEGEKDHLYDSDGKPEEQSPVLMSQFRHVAGREAEVNLSAFGGGEGFRGLDAAWDEYAEANPDRERVADMNRENYGDARLDRMFTQGLDLLFGPDAGRAKGRARTLTAGETFSVFLVVPGIGGEDTEVEHTCEVRSVEGGEAVLAVTWALNGLKPTATEDGVITTRGLDLKGSAELTFHLASGLLTSLRQDLKRTDQVARGGLGVGMIQKTRRIHEVKEFDLSRRK